MPDFARYGLTLALLIAAGVTCLFLAFAPTAHTPSADHMTGEAAVNIVHPIPYTPDRAEETTNA